MSAAYRVSLRIEVRSRDGETWTEHAFECGDCQGQPRWMNRGRVITCDRCGGSGEELDDDCTCRECLVERDVAERRARLVVNTQQEGVAL